MCIRDRCAPCVVHACFSRCVGNARHAQVVFSTQAVRPSVPTKKIRRRPPLSITPPCTPAALRYGTPTSQAPHSHPRVDLTPQSSTPLPHEGARGGGQCVPRDLYVPVAYRPQLLSLNARWACQNISDGSQSGTRSSCSWWKRTVYQNLIICTWT